MMCAPCGLAADLNVSAPAWRLPDAVIVKALDQGFELADLVSNRPHVVEALHGRCQAEEGGRIAARPEAVRHNPKMITQPPGCPCQHRFQDMTS